VEVGGREGIDSNLFGLAPQSHPNLQPSKIEKGGTSDGTVIIVALVLAIPIMLIPVVFGWHLNIGGIYAAIKEARER